MSLTNSKAQTVLFGIAPEGYSMIAGFVDERLSASASGQFIDMKKAMELAKILQDKFGFEGLVKAELESVEPPAKAASASMLSKNAFTDAVVEPASVAIVIGFLAGALVRYLGAKEGLRTAKDRGAIAVPEFDIPVIRDTLYVPVAAAYASLKNRLNDGTLAKDIAGATAVTVEESFTKDEVFSVGVYFLFGALCGAACTQGSMPSWW